MTGWTVTLESSGPPSVRESFDCAPHLSVPVRWTLALDNRAISQQGDGATVQESPFNHGELRALGPERSDQRLRLNTLEDAGEAGEAFYWSYPEFKRNQAPTLSLSGTGDVAELYGSYRHSETLIASFRLQGVREPTP